MTRAEAQELLGAWAAGALDPETAVAVEAVLAADAELRREAARLEGAAALLAALTATAPPPDLAARILARAGALRAPGRSAHAGEPAGPLGVWLDRVADADTALSTVGPDDWSRPAPPYPWTVRQLLQHLVAVERYVAGILGAGAAHGAPDHLALLAHDLDGVPPAGVLAAWRDAVGVTRSHLGAAGPSRLADAVTFHGFPMGIGSLLVVRGFELWTHADDVRRALGRPVADPPAPVVHTMSDLSVRSLELLAGPALVPTRVVLTGPGGGAWTLPAGTGEAPALRLTADAVTYCRWASRRATFSELAATVDGDEAVARDVLAAAQALAF